MLEKLKICERPAIIAGHGIIRDRASLILKEVAEKLGAPVATSRSGIGSLSTSHPQSVGMLGFYGTATARKIADTLWTEQDKTDGLIREGDDVGDVATRGLTYLKKQMIDNQCAQLLAPSDWMVVRATETGGTMDSGWKTWRASVRTKCNSMQTQIDNAADVDALAALFTYTTTDGVTSRPLGEFPEKE